MDKFDGLAYLKITSADPAGVLQKIQQTGVCIYDVVSLDAFSIQFTASRKDIRTIIKLCEKRGDRVDIEGITGLICYMRNILRRPLILVGVLVWLCLALWLPTRILFVRVSGAERLTDTYILECAADCGIQMGASSKDVRSESVKNALLSKIPELGWAGVNTAGCVATVCVQEKNTENKATDQISLSDILAMQDAVVREIIVHSGTPLCQPGQAVKRGQALISSYRDNGQILEFTGASGEVYGDTKRNIQANALLKGYKRTRIISTSKNFYVIIGKKTINFNKDSGILDGSCVKMYEVKECVLPGGFALPVSFVTETITLYETEQITFSAEDCVWLKAYTRNYLENEMIAGSILSESITEDFTEEVYLIRGVYNCREMIADYEYKGITDKYGEND